MTKKLISKLKYGFVIAVGLALGFSPFMGVANAAACVPGQGFGSMVRDNVSVSSAGSYAVWARMKVANIMGASAGIEVTRSGGTPNCYTATSTSTANWQWRKVGTTNFTQSGNVIKVVGLENNVQIDRVILIAANQDCTPSESRQFTSSGVEEPGDNCVNVVVTPTTPTDPAVPTEPTTPTNPTTPTTPTTNQPPTKPGSLNAKLRFDISKFRYVYDVSWTASTDSDGSILSYEVSRDGAVFGSTDGSLTKFTDSSDLVAGRSYTYSVKAQDNKGARSEAAKVTVKPVCFLIWCR